MSSSARSSSSKQAASKQSKHKADVAAVEPATPEKKAKKRSHKIAVSDDDEEEQSHEAQINKFLEEEDKEDIEPTDEKYVTPPKARSATGEKKLTLIPVTPEKPARKKLRTDEDTEEKTSEETMVVSSCGAAAAAAADGPVVTSNFFAPTQQLSAYVNDPPLYLIMSSDDHNPVPWMRKIMSDTKRAVGMMKLGKLFTNCIHTARLLNSLYWEELNHPMELEYAFNLLQVSQTKAEKKIFDPKTRTYRTEALDQYVNSKMKRPQYWGGRELYGLHSHSPFYATLPGSFMQWGPTDETGVNGNVGRILDKKKGPTPAAEASYSFFATNGSFTALSVDEQFDDAVMSWYLHTHIKDVLFGGQLEKALAIPGAFRREREAMLKHFQLIKEPAPESLKEQAKWIVHNFFGIKLNKLDGNDTGLGLSMSECVHRKVRMIYNNGVKVGEEDLTGCPPPSPMFTEAACIMDNKGNKRTHRRLPLLVWRSAAEVDPEIAKLPPSDPRSYKSAWVEVPFENAAINGGGHIISSLVQSGLYEIIDKDKVDFGGTLKPRGSTWLNTKSGMDEEIRKGLQPVDPRFCMPGAAGIKGYKGPVDLQREADERGKRETEKYNSAIAANAKASEEADDAAMVVAADAAERKQKE